LVKEDVGYAVRLRLTAMLRASLQSIAARSRDPAELAGRPKASA